MVVVDQKPTNILFLDCFRGDLKIKYFLAYFNTVNCETPNWLLLFNYVNLACANFVIVHSIVMVLLWCSNSFTLIHESKFI